MLSVFMPLQYTYIELDKMNVFPLTVCRIVAKKVLFLHCKSGFCTTMSKKMRNKCCSIFRFLLPLEVLDMKSNLEELSLQGKRRGLLNLKSLLTSKRKLRLLLKLKKKKQFSVDLLIPWQSNQAMPKLFQMTVNSLLLILESVTLMFKMNLQIPSIQAVLTLATGTVRMRSNTS